MKKEFHLEGLCCSNCAAKIEKTVAKLPGLSNASLNFATTLLSVELQSPESANQIEMEIKNIISKIEPDVIVVEKKISGSREHTIMLLGLCCMNCANKIESKVKNIGGVNKAALDFTNQKLKVDIADFSDHDVVIAEIRELVKQIEPDVKVISEESETGDNQTFIPVKGEKRIEHALSVLGVILFAAAYLIESQEYSVISFIAAYLLIGYDVLWRALRNLLRGDLFDENFLMGLATVGAIAIKEYPEAVTVMFFYKIGEYLQGRAVNKSRRAIADLLNLKPATGTVIRNGTELKLAPEAILVGDILAVRPGEKIALDGIVLEGSSLIDASALTGESVPFEVSTGSEVLSGSINRRGLLKLKVIRPYAESAVARIIEQVQNAAQNKAATEMFITRFARVYTPAVVVIAVLIAFLPPLLVSGALYSDWIYRALVFLVVSCPCALVLSIPLGFFGGIGAASKAGVLIKGGNYLESLTKVRTIVFDKTGTLTRGVFKISKIVPQNPISSKQLMLYAAAGELYSNHPIALSVSKEFTGKINSDDITAYDEIAGLGTITIWQNMRIVCGNEALFKREKIEYTPAVQSGTILYIAVDNRYCGYLLISDEVKPDAAQAVQKLQKLGIRVCMLTGDNASIAASTAAKIGITEFHAGLLPLDKVNLLEKWQKEQTDGKVAFVGDGLNDAPVLARADVGIAMGGLGSDAAIEAADVVIMNDELSKIVTALEIANFTKKIVWQNIFWAFAIKLAVLVLGAFGAATMWEAIFADVGVALLAVSNALRLIRRKF